jgi:hypothetical protein
MATQIATSSVTVAILIFMLIVFHFSRCEQPLRSVGLAGLSSSRMLYLNSEGLNRRDKCDGTRGMIFGRYTIVRLRMPGEDGLLSRCQTGGDDDVKRVKQDSPEMRQLTNDNER